MTTTINTFEDFIRIMDENPEWLEAARSRLLTRELLDLPQVVAELSETVQQLAVAQARFTESANARFDKLEKSMAELSATLAQFMETTNARFDKLEKSMAELSATLARFMESTNARLDALETTQTRFMETTNARFDKLESAMAELAAAHVRLDENVRVMRLDLDSIKGDHMEMRLQGRIHGLLSLRLGVRRVQVVRALYPGGSLPAFDNAIHDADEMGDITDEQYNRLMSTDLIAKSRRGRGAEGRDVYTPVEVSNQIDRDDVDRVVQSAQALALIYSDAEILPAVYGARMSEQDRTYAQDRGVYVFLRRPQR